MSQGFVLDLTQQALLTALLIAGPLLAMSLVVGLVIAVFQATTQINEQTLTFVPKIAAVGVAMVLFGPWMLNTLMHFTTRIFTDVPGWIR